MNTKLQAADHEIISILMRNNNRYPNVDLYKGMLENLLRITDYVQNQLALCVMEDK